MIRRLLYKFHRWVQNYGEQDLIVASDCKSVTSIRGPNSEGMRFNVYHASGGMILEFSRYDPKTDRNDHKLYVIPENESDTTHRIAQIVMMETMRF
jgi:hypothetical protein